MKFFYIFFNFIFIFFSFNYLVDFDFGRVYDIFIEEKDADVFYKKFSTYTKYKPNKKDLIKAIKNNDDINYNYLKYSRTRILAPLSL